VQLTTPAVWDTRTQRFYAGAQSASPGPNSILSYLLLSWAARTACTATLTPEQASLQAPDPAPHQAGVHVAALVQANMSRMPLPRAVHSVWPVGAPGGPDEGEDGPSTSGRDASRGSDSGAWGAGPGVVIVHADGSVALNTQYMNGKTRTAKPGEGRAVAAAGCHGLIAVVTVDSQRRHKAAIYAPLVRNGPSRSRKDKNPHSLPFPVNKFLTLLLLSHCRNISRHTTIIIFIKAATYVFAGGAPVFEFCS
jgi:hypothetical protein